MGFADHYLSRQNIYPQFISDKPGQDLRIVIVIPCYNEEITLKRCVERVMEIGDLCLDLEIIIVDDASSDRSLLIARNLKNQYPEIIVLSHSQNKGKEGSGLLQNFLES